MTVHQIWLTCAEIACLGTPGLPHDARRVREWARSEGWTQITFADGTPRARPRRGRGGGTEYHASLLPLSAQMELYQEAYRATASDTLARKNKAGWVWHARQPLASQRKAYERLDAVTNAQAWWDAGLSVDTANYYAAEAHGVSKSAVASWRLLVRGVPVHDWLLVLTPRYYETRHALAACDRILAGLQRRERRSILLELLEGEVEV